MEKFWNDTNVIEISKQYKTRSELQKKSPGAYRYAYKHKLLNKLFPNRK